MQYLYAAVLVLVGLLNLRLVRVGMDKGRIQARFLDITREARPVAFWLVITLQCCITMVFFILALGRINPS